MTGSCGSASLLPGVLPGRLPALFAPMVSSKNRCNSPYDLHVICFVLTPRRHAERRPLVGSLRGRVERETFVARSCTHYGRVANWPDGKRMRETKREERTGTVFLKTPPVVATSKEMPELVREAHVSYGTDS